MEPWKEEEWSKQNSSSLFCPSWNLPEQSEAERALGHFPTGCCWRHWAQASVSNVRLPFPYLSKLLSGAYGPSHQWKRMNTLYLAKVFSPTTNKATSIQTHMQERGGKWPTGQLTLRVELPSHPFGLILHRGGYVENFRVPFFPLNGAPLHVMLYLSLTNPAQKSRTTLSQIKRSPRGNDLTGHVHLSWTAVTRVLKAREHTWGRRTSVSLNHTKQAQHRTENPKSGQGRLNR